MRIIIIGRNFFKRKNLYFENESKSIKITLSKHILTGSSIRISFYKYVKVL